MVKKILKSIVPLLILAGAVAAAGALVRARPEVKPREKERLVPLVEVTPAARESVRLDVNAYGTVLPRTEITLVPQVTGRVTWVSPSFRDGGFFAKDQALVRIEKRDYELAVTQADAVVAQAEAALLREEAEAAIAREEWEVYGKGEPNPLAVREPQLAEAKAMLASAEARRDLARLDLSRTEIAAPYDGRVRRESVDVGQFLAAGAPIGTIYATDYAEVRLEIPDDELAFLDLPLDRSTEAAGPTGDPEGLIARIVAVFAGREFEWRGTIVRTAAELDPKTRVVRTLARVEDPYAEGSGRPPLLVGMYVRAVIPGRTALDVTVVPRDAFRGSDVIHVVDAQDRLRIRKVEVLRKERDRVIVSGGLAEGERVSLTQLHPAIEGMRVRVVEAETGR